MKSSKRTLPTKGRKKVTETSSIIPGNDIFDIIDYYYTYERGRRDQFNEIEEQLGLAALEAVRIHEDKVQEAETLQQIIAEKENKLKKLNKESQEAARLRKEIEAHKKRKKEVMTELEEMKVSVEASNLIRKIYGL